MPIHIDRLLIILGAAGLAAGCHDSPSRPAGGPSLRFSGAVDVADTIDALVPQPVVVEVHDSTGALARPGTLVQFAPVPLSFDLAEVYVRVTTGSAFTNYVEGSVDQSGRASVLVKLGKRAMTARLVVRAPDLTLQDTVHFTVKPGNAVRAIAAPAETTLYVGKSYTVRGATVDRLDNPRPDPVTFSTLGSGVTVTTGGEATTTALGRYLIRSDAVGLVANGVSFVTVVPPGRAAAVLPTPNTRGFTLFAVDLDGTNRTTLATGTNGGIGVHAAWIPGTSNVVFTALTNGFQTLYVVGADGVTKPLLTALPPTVIHQAEPTPTADGRWLFFSVQDTRCSTSDYCVAHAKIDGSGYELLSSIPSRQPAPSPDGSQVAFMTPNDQLIRVYDVATRTPSAWSVAGSTPSWSPDGSRIAFRNADGGVSIIAPDGTGQRIVKPASTVAVLGWSPDNRWLLVQEFGDTVLIDPETGLRLPLFSATTLGATSVK